MKQTMKRFLKKYISYPLEAFGVYFIYALTSALSLKASSDLCGWLGRKLGRYTKPSRVAQKNLKRVFPHLSAAETSKIIDNVWDNFGRTMGEYTNLHKCNVYQHPCFEVRGTDIIDQLIHDQQPAIIFSAHLASWEPAIMAANQRGLKLSQIYRKANNPWVENIVRHSQKRVGQELITKGHNDGRQIMHLLKKGGHLFFLLDHKLNSGMSIPFFGHPAMTATAPVRLAMKFKCPLVPVRVIRTHGCHYIIEYEPPLKLRDTGELRNDMFQNLLKVNQTIERWVYEHPDQWLWIHNRWGK